MVTPLQLSEQFVVDLLELRRALFEWLSFDELDTTEQTVFRGSRSCRLARLSLGQLVLDSAHGSSLVIPSDTDGVFHKLRSEVPAESF